MIDWLKVSELRAEIGEEDFVEIVDVFIQEVDEEMQDLRKGLVSEKALRSRLHFLKGSALNLGFCTFSTLCTDGENAAAQGAYDRIDLGKIIETYDRSKTMFLSELEARLTD